MGRSAKQQAKFLKEKQLKINQAILDQDVGKIGHLMHKGYLSKKQKEAVQTRAVRRGVREPIQSNVHHFYKATIRSIAKRATIMRVSGEAIKDFQYTTEILAKRLIGAAKIVRKDKDRRLTGEQAAFVVSFIFGQEYANRAVQWTYSHIRSDHTKVRQSSDIKGVEGLKQSVLAKKFEDSVEPIFVESVGRFSRAAHETGLVLSRKAALVLLYALSNFGERWIESTKAYIDHTKRQTLLATDLEFARQNDSRIQINHIIMD